MLLIQTMCCGLGGGVYKKGRGCVFGYMGDRVRGMRVGDLVREYVYEDVGVW